MRSFTHSCSVVYFLLSGLFLLIFTSQITAQSHVLTVSEPAAIAGDYQAEMSSFGRNFCTVTGELIQAKDASNGTLGCNTSVITTDLTGKIAVLDRGSCDFSDKVLNAQKKGAIAVIIFNNVSTSPVIFSAGNGASGPQVTIPSFMVSLATANKIKPLLGSAVKVTIKSNTPDFVNPNLVVWGNSSKQGDFDGGLNAWTSNTVSCSGKPNTATAWSWISANAFADPCFFAYPAQPSFFSPTRCNGAMIMNAATLDLGSITTCNSGFGQGPCPTPHTGELISPTIKVTKGTALNVSFYQYFRHFYGSEYFVEWSKDGGKTWVSSQINEEIRPFEENEDPYKSVRLIGSENADSVKIKFRYDGNFYFWAIDDVKLVKREANNLALTQFYALSPNMQQPANQAETIPFGAAVENIGANAQTNLKLYINAIDSTTNSRIFRDSLTSASIAPNQIDTAIFAPKFLPNKKGTYAMVYQASADSTDYDRFDNLEGFFFRVTDTTFAKELGASFYTLPGDNWDVNEPHSAAYGNSYYVVKGKGNYLRSVSFGVNNGADLQGISLLVSLYTWEDRNQNALVESTERDLIADNFYDIKGTETGARLITVPFPEQGEPAVQLADTTTYLVMIEYFTGDDTDIELLLNDTYDRRPMLLTGFATDKPRYASFTALDSDLGTVTYSPTGYGLENVYVVRMNVGPLVISSDRDLPSISNEFAISPNPAREDIYLQLALNKVSKQANVRIMDMAGRQIMEKVYTNVKRDQFQISVDGLPAGTYLMQVTTENGTGTKKFVKSGE
ncbi:MAG: PA domain-containing protein [Haliscomenobacter sp.]|uniref:T9SS type A sorting domain-containing protein n=1 Tax=Haliscomenobacter sp. TaxID=2717303 RepID=UPI0029B43F2C|nr:PA domain-containing protein [Haliscomenobacter sp.]MDX2070719.1 PA domain-containing protein [Haliscomenobacter sp.]